MKILTEWLREYLPGIPVDDHKLVEDLTLRGMAVDGAFDLGAGNGLLLEMDITTNRVDAMNHYGIAREASAIYGLTLPALDTSLPCFGRESRVLILCGLRLLNFVGALLPACCVE